MAATTTATEASAAPPALAESLRRLDRSALGWAAIAVALSAGVGALVSADSKIVVIAAVLVGAAGLFVWQPYAALLGLLVLGALSPSSVFLKLVALAGGALALVVTPARLPAKWVTLPFLLLLLISLASVPLSPSSDEGERTQWLTLPKLGTPYLATPSGELLEWLALASVAVVFCISALAIRDAQRLRTLVTVVLASAVVPIAAGLYDLAMGNFTKRAEVEAIEGIFDHPNHFALYLLTILTLAIVSLLEARRPRTVLALTALVASASVCLFVTYTRAAWVGLVLVLVVLAVVRYRRLWIAGAAVLVVALTVFPSAAGRVEQRFGEVVVSSPVERNSWSWRKGQWERMLPHGSDRPLTGQGFGSYSRITVKEFGLTDPAFSTVQDPRFAAGAVKGFTAHNDYVKMFVEMGVPGLLLWTGILVGLLLLMLGSRRGGEAEPYATAMFALVAALLLISINANVQVRTTVVWFVFALCGAVLGVRSASRRTSAPTPALAQPPQESKPAEPPRPAPPPVDETPPRPPRSLRRMVRRLRRRR